MKRKSAGLFALFLMTALVSAANAADVHSAACSVSVYKETQNFHDFQDPLQKTPSKTFALRGDEVAQEIATLEGVTYSIIDIKSFRGPIAILEVKTASGKTQTIEPYLTVGSTAHVTYIANGKSTVVSCEFFERQADQLFSGF